MVHNKKKYDYVILGGGASGLSLAYRIANNPWFSNKKIALVEKDKKKTNDRTWCFWIDENHDFENIVKHKWTNLLFYGNQKSINLSMGKFSYQMIEGLDFYNFVYPILENSPNIEVIREKIITTEENDEFVEIKTQNYNLLSRIVFKSYFDHDIDKSKHIYTDQHFKGYFIETPNPEFDDKKAILMDFRIPQNDEVRFLYVLPKSPTKALVELAIFSNNLLNHSDYELIIDEYIEKYLQIESYRIIRKEYGVIPMTTYPFASHNTNRIIHIGTAGGIVKASSGYAFERIQKHSKQLIQCIIDNQSFDKSYKGLFGRHFLYDKIMMHAMLEGGVSGKKIFNDLFSKQKASRIFTFLNHKTSLIEEMMLFTAPPFFPFLKSLFKVLVKKP